MKYTTPRRVTFRPLPPIGILCSDTDYSAHLVLRTAGPRKVHVPAVEVFPPRRAGRYRPTGAAQPLGRRGNALRCGSRQPYGHGRRALRPRNSSPPNEQRFPLRKTVMAKVSVDGTDGDHRNPLITIPLWTPRRSPPVSPPPEGGIRHRFRRSRRRHFHSRRTAPVDVAGASAGGGGGRKAEARPTHGWNGL